MIERVLVLSKADNVYTIKAYSTKISIFNARDENDKQWGFEVSVSIQLDMFFVCMHIE